MQDCDTCRLMKAELCGGLECQGYEPLPQITDEDRAIYQNATDQLDKDSHPTNRHSSRRVLRAEEQFKTVTQPASDYNPKIVSPEIAERRFQELKRWRLAESRASGYKAFYIFTDQTLRAIAARNVTCKADLLGISGVGSKKYNQYGEAVYNILSSIR